MRQAVFLCDHSWKVEKVLVNSLGCAIAEGMRLGDIVADEGALPDAQALTERKRAFASLRFPEMPSDIPALIFSYPKRVLVAAACVRGPEEFTEFQKRLISHLAWADDNVASPYRDEYYEIALLNNRLLNSERALAKKNARLERALNEIRQANDSIAILERDRVTNLYGARGFDRRLAQLMREGGAARYEVAALEVDGMRLVDEMYGARTRDKLLQAIAAFLAGLDEGGTVVLACVDRSTFYALSTDAVRFHNTIETRFPDFSNSYPFPVHLRARIGVYDVDDPSISGEEARNRAHLALDATHRRGGGVAYFDSALKEELVQRSRLLDRLPRALADDEFKLYLQPKVDMGTRNVVGAEALVRWKHPELGFVSPAQFIPLFEREGCIYDVDRAIWEKACAFIGDRRRRGLPVFPLSVNVARADLYEPGLVEDLCDMAKRHGLRPGDLHLEVLERAWAKDSQTACEAFGELKGRGFPIEMDDFGTGESSLALLANLPVDVLKLDRGFVSRVLESPRSLGIVRCIIELARTLDMSVVAEGVETEGQQDALVSLGCRFAQGFLYYKPQAAEAFRDLGCSDEP